MTCDRSVRAVARRLSLLLAMVLTLALAGSVTAQDATPATGTPVAGSSGQAIEAATAWLLQEQDPAGGFPGFDGAPDAGTTIDVILALSAAEASGVDTNDAIPAAVEFLGSGDVALVYAQTGVGQAAKLVLGLHAAGVDPPTIASVDPVSILTAGQDPDTGVFGAGPFDHALALLALGVVDEPVPATALDALTATQAPNGGWGFDGLPDDATVDSNTTAVVVQALVATGNADVKVVTAALEYLETTVSDGGAAFAADPSAPADANSTALVLQARIATGEETSDLVSSLLSFQNASGAFFFTSDDPSDNLFSTVQAIPALAGYAVPIEPAA